MRGVEVNDAEGEGGGGRVHSLIWPRPVRDAGQGMVSKDLWRL